MSSKEVTVIEHDEPKSALEQFRAAMGGDGVAIPGLESVNQKDLTIPQIAIDHQAGKFVDRLTGETSDSIDGVLLGLLKAQVMWPPQQSAPGQKPQPLCRSRDAVSGVPGETFPWADFKKGAEKNAEYSPEPLGSPEIACATCYFAQWGSDVKSDSPRCTQQYVFPVMKRQGDGEYILNGLFTVQRTGIRPANAYISGFVRDGLPLFMHHTTVTLDVNRNGTVQFAVPKFRRGEATPADAELWQSWAKTFEGIKRTTQKRDLGDSLVVTSTEESPF